MLCPYTRLNDPQYIRRLIAQVIAVSLETDRIVRNLPDLAVDIPALTLRRRLIAPSPLPTAVHLP